MSWELIASVGAWLAIALLNLVSRNYSEHKGIVKVITMVTEWLSIFCSKGCTQGPLKKLKLPFQNVKPKGPVKRI